MAQACIYLVLFFQEELYKIIHGILVNSETREAAMHYIATVLNRNVKKSQIQVFFIFCLVKLPLSCMFLYFWWEANFQNFMKLIRLIFINVKMPNDKCEIDVCKSWTCISIGKMQNFTISYVVKEMAMYYIWGVFSVQWLSCWPFNFSISGWSSTLPVSWMRL